jgi:hypothetical protein
MKRFVLALGNVAVLCLGVGLSGAAMAQAAQNQPAPEAAQSQLQPQAAPNQEAPASPHPPPAAA